MPGARMFRMVAMMLIEPRIDEIPSKCTDKMTKSMPMPARTVNGGYNVQPACGAPPGAISEHNKSRPAGGKIQKLQLFMRGSAMSGAPIIIGICQFARPTKAGMTKPNTMISPCRAVIWLKNPGSTTCRPGCQSSARMIKAMIPPTIAMANENHR